MCEKDIIIALKPIYRDVCDMLQDIRDNPSVSTSMRNAEMQALLWQVKDAIEDYSEKTVQYNYQKQKNEENSYDSKTNSNH